MKDDMNKEDMKKMGTTQAVEKGYALPTGTTKTEPAVFWTAHLKFCDDGAVVINDDRRPNVASFKLEYDKVKGVTITVTEDSPM